MNKQERLELANQVIAEIAKRGRRFFAHKDRIARLEIDKRGRIWYINPESQKRIYTHHNRDEWRNFNGGGTLQDVIRRFRDFVRDGHCTINVYWLGFAPHTWGYPLEDLLPIWQLAKPMFGDEALKHLEEVLSQLQEVA